MKKLERGLVASTLIIAGGAAKIPLWILYISLHGPTSFDQDRHFLGGDPLIWGAIMSAVPSLLVASGLIGWVGVLGVGVARRVGLILLLSGLVIPAAVDLVSRVLWPPFLIPIVAAGALLIGITSRAEPRVPRLSSVALLVVAVLLGATFVYALMIPTAVFDQIDGYRLQGIVEHILVGLAWIAVGVGLLGGARSNRSG